MSVDLSLREVDGVTVVNAPNRLTLGQGAGMLRYSLRDLLVAGHKKILLDLGGITALDSSGLGDLVASFAMINSQDGQIKLLNVTNRVKDLLFLTKLHTIFEVFEDEADAVSSFR